MTEKNKYKRFLGSFKQLESVCKHNIIKFIPSLILASTYEALYVTQSVRVRLFEY